jgi:hypothetical protein
MILSTAKPLPKSSVTVIVIYRVDQGDIFDGLCRRDRWLQEERAEPSTNNQDIGESRYLINQH